MIPVVNIAPFLEYEKTKRFDQIKDIVGEWKRAFESIGFVIVKGHCIPDSVCDKLQEDCVTFFKSDAEKKASVDLKKGYGKGGYVGLGEEVVSKTMVFNKQDAEGTGSETDQKQNVSEEKQNGKKAIPDLVETLEFIEGYDDEISQHIFPENPHTFEASVSAYWDSLRVFYRRMLHISALALGLNEDFFDNYFAAPYERLRLAFYPAQEASKPVAGQLRYGPHTDYACFAIVRSDDAPGLEVLGKGGNWIPVKWQPGTFIVNAGDLLQRWTNDCWRSVIHRVANPPPEKANVHRLSLVLFVGPNRNSLIEPLDTCVSNNNGAKYKPITCGEHLKRKINISSIKSKKLDA